MPALSPASIRNPTNVSRTCDNTRFPSLQHSPETGSWASMLEGCGLYVIKQIWIKSQQWLSPQEHPVGTTLMCSNQGDLTEFYNPEQTLNNFDELGFQLCKDRAAKCKELKCCCPDEEFSCLKIMIQVTKRNFSCRGSQSQLDSLSSVSFIRMENTAACALS